MNKHPILIAGLLLATFAVGGTGLVAFTYDQTAERIAANERAALLKSLHALVPAETIDNDIVEDVIQVSNMDRLGGNDIQVYRGRKGGKPVAAVFTTTVPDGYSGPIKLLVAVNADKTLGGVRVISHKETPGLGDKIEEEKDDWIFSFKGKSLSNPNITRWKVKRDGGDFDQFTGATITPRSIVNAVKNTLLYYDNHAKTLFETPVTNVASAQ
ncbi:MAG: electron transport complex subunit RsxG [Chromatiales bacterium]|nr:electron transport complex subunit RsxG [Chromatiales bacterium]